MFRHGRCWLLGLLLGTTALMGAGCDFATMAYFFMPEAREPAIIRHLASEDKKKEPRVVILTDFRNLETRVELIQADRQIAELLAKTLRGMAEESQEKLAVVPQRKVEEYKNIHPEWETQGLAKIGRDLAADYVISLEIHSLELYERKSLSQFLRGRADMTVTLVEVNKPDDLPDTRHFNTTFPSDARGGVDMFDANPYTFRQHFLNHVARQLAWHFANYPKRDKQFVEGPGLFQ
jgi:hypothetical protein